MAYGNGDGTTGIYVSTDTYKKLTNAFKAALVGAYNSYNSEALWYSGTDSYWWSSTASNGTSRYYLVINTSTVFPLYDLDSRDIGRSIRCVAKTMQSTSTIEECKAMTAGQTMIAYDKRDGSDYTIGKLADGKCWMLQNLRIGGNSAMTLTSADTNISASSWTLPALSSSLPTDGESYDGAYISQPIGTAKIYSNSAWKNTTDTTAMGILYNYAAATAGTIIGNVTAPDASSDICPKNWKLPNTGSVTSDFGTLTIAYKGNTDGLTSFSNSTQAYQDFNNAFQTTLAGYFGGGSVKNVGYHVYYWASTGSGTSSRRDLHVDSSKVVPTNFDSAYYGNSIRCVAK